MNVNSMHIHVHVQCISQKSHITHIKNFKVVEAVVDGLEKALGKEVLHGLLEELGWLRLKVLDNLILLHECMEVGQGLHVVLSIAKVHIKLIGLKGGSEKRRECSVCTCVWGGGGGRRRRRGRKGKRKRVREEK